MPNISDYSSVVSNLFVRIEVDYFKASPEAEPTSTVWCFGDSLLPYVINDETYYGVGKLMGITETNSDIKATSSQLTITLSGIPNTSIFELVNSRIKGCPLTVYRVLLTPDMQPVVIDADIGTNVLARYRGYVNNYALQEDYDIGSKTSTNTLVLTCSSTVDVLNNKIAGRKTNSFSQKKFFPNDLSMDRVSALENSSFNFGTPKA